MTSHNCLPCWITVFKLRQDHFTIHHHVSISIFQNSVKDAKDRSVCNIPFVTPSKESDAKFVAEADALGFKNIKGHRSVGGMRASVYNAFPRQGVLDLIDFMKKFEAENK